MSLIKKIFTLILFILFLITVLWFKPLPSFKHDSPRRLPWALPDYRQAKTSVSVLDDGRIKISIEHFPLIGIEPKMVAWFYQNLPISTVEISGQHYPWYHIFHPKEHGLISVKEPARDIRAGMGVGALVSRQEWFGKYNSKGSGRIIEFSAQGMTVKPELLGLHFGKIKHSFTQVPYISKENKTQQLGTRYKVESIIGSDLPVIGPLINYYIRNKMFSPAMIKEWLRHQVEEVSSLQFFLKELYQTKPQGNHYQLKLNQQQYDTLDFSISKEVQTNFEGAH